MEIFLLTCLLLFQLYIVNSSGEHWDQLLVSLGVNSGYNIQY